jgi:ribonuclease HII
LIKEEERERLYGEIVSRAVGWATGVATEKEIDRVNILEAARLAFLRAVEAIFPPPDYLLLDAISLPQLSIPQRSVVKGDQLSVSIAAASIVAKVSRDRLMQDYHHRFPQYQFHRHKGYPTPEHLRLLAEFGPCDGHRHSFQPVKKSLRSKKSGVRNSQACSS